MSTSLLITLADFPDFVPFSVNIDESLVNPHIRDAQTMELWPLLPLALRAELATPRAGWLPATAVLFTDFVRPLLVVESARKMLLYHGAHVTAAGLQTVSDPSIGAQPVAGAWRTELRADLAAKCTHYRSRLDGALRLAYPTTYANTCSGPRRRPTSGGLQISDV